MAGAKDIISRPVFNICTTKHVGSKDDWRTTSLRLTTISGMGCRRRPFVDQLMRREVDHVLAITVDIARFPSSTKSAAGHDVIDIARA